VTVSLSDDARRVLDAKSFAVVATLNPDGSPQTSVVWVGLVDEAVVFSTTRQRRKGRNLARDPRVSITVIDPEDPYKFLEVRGRAELIDDPERSFGSAMWQKYLGQEAPADRPGVERMIVRVVPEKVTGPLA
jgi:PPOX class probable F420-dependent enzyme